MHAPICGFVLREIMSSVISPPIFMFMRQLVLIGLAELDVGDWQRSAIYRNYTATSSQIVWFWEVRRRVFGALVHKHTHICICIGNVADDQGGAFVGQ
jgi:hypothetical protein